MKNRYFICNLTNKTIIAEIVDDDQNEIDISNYNLKEDQSIEVFKGKSTSLDKFSIVGGKVKVNKKFISGAIEE